MVDIDKLHFHAHLSNFEEQLVTGIKLANSNLNNISSIKMYLTYMYKLNKRLKALNKNLQSTHCLADWEGNAQLGKILKIQLKMSLKKIKCNEFEVNCEQMKKRNCLRKRIAAKTKRCKSYKTHLHNKKEYFDTKINIWMKEYQNEIMEEKAKKKLKKDADVILTDIRIKRLSAKKSLFVLQELNHYRKLKIDVSRISGNLITTEANHVIHNIFTKLINQWKTLSREYCLEEKGLKLMMETDNVNKTLNCTKNVFNDWETNLFKNKLSVAYKLIENNHFLTLRVLWDNFLTKNEGNEIPPGWIIPCTFTSNGWIKYMK